MWLFRRAWLLWRVKTRKPHFTKKQDCLCDECIYHTEKEPRCHYGCECCHVGFRIESAESKHMPLPEMRLITR